jgi:hypothetical protein
MKMTMLPKAIHMFNAIPMKNSNDILHRNRKNNCEIDTEEQKTSNSQRNSEQKGQCWRHHNTRPQTILQSHNNKNSMVLALKQTGRPTDPDINSCIYSQLIFDKGAQSTRWRRQHLQQMLLGKMDIHMLKTEIRSLPFTLYQNQLKVDQRLQYNIK